MTTEMPAAKWEKIVDAHFHFLRTEFGCGIVDRSDKSGWTTEVTYQNATTAVVVSYDIEFDGVEVLLVRLLNGRRPPYPIFVSEEAALHNHWMARLVQLRAPALLSGPLSGRGLKPDHVQSQLSMWANAVRDYAADVLRGDFSVFEVMEKDVRDYVREHPEQIKIWAPGGEEASANATVEQLQLQHPKIPVEVHSYSAPRGRSFVDRIRKWLGPRG